MCWLDDGMTGPCVSLNHTRLGWSLTLAVVCGSSLTPLTRGWWPHTSPEHNQDKLNWIKDILGFKTFWGWKILWGCKTLGHWRVKPKTKRFKQYFIGELQNEQDIIFENLINIYSIHYCSDEVWRGGMRGMQWLSGWGQEEEIKQLDNNRQSPGGGGGCWAVSWLHAGKSLIIVFHTHTAH